MGKLHQISLNIGINLKWVKYKLEVDFNMFDGKKGLNASIFLFRNQTKIM